MSENNQPNVSVRDARAVLVRLDKVYPWGLAIGRDLRDQHLFVDRGTTGVDFGKLRPGQVLWVLPNHFGFAYWAGRA